MTMITKTALCVALALCIPGLPAWAGKGGAVAGGGAGSGIVASSKTTPAASGVRILEFPGDISVGRIVAIDPAFEPQNKHLLGKAVAECRGRVSVPAGLSLMLIANDLLTEHPQALDKLPADALTGMVLTKAIFSDEGAAHLSRLTGLRYLDMEGSEISDAGLKHLGTLVNLVHFNASRTMMKGQTLDALSGLHKLVYLNLGCNDFNHNSFVLLGKLTMPHLVQLDLSRTGLQDVDLQYVARHTSTVTLEITDNRGVTDRGLYRLAPMKHLQGLNARQTGITVRGLANLRPLQLDCVALGQDMRNTMDEKKVHEIFPRLRITYDRRGAAAPTELFSPLH